MRVIGREREQRALTAAVDEADALGGVVLLVGDPGSGKSLLLDAAADHAKAGGRLVLRASGARTETELPYAGLHQLTRPLLAGL